MIKIRSNNYLVLNEELIDSNLPPKRMYDVWFIVPEGKAHPIHNPEGKPTVILHRTELVDTDVPSAYTNELAYGAIHKAILELEHLK